MGSRTHALVFVLAVSTLVACRAAPPDAALSSAVQAVLSGKAEGAKDVWKETGQFYADRANEPAWVTNAGKVPQADAILTTLGNAGAHGLPGDYGREALTAAIVAAGEREGTLEERASELAQLDVRITTDLLSLGHDVALGRTSPSVVTSTWKRKRMPPPFVTLLAARADDGIGTWLEAVQPVHPEYARLQQGLKALEGQREKGGWPRVEAKALKPGRRAPAVVTLRQRLAASGELSDATDSSRYDDSVVAAVKAFQEHHTLNATGEADAATIAAMNVPIEDRITQVALNLERWRWMPDDFGDRHFLVNIPAYHVYAREHGKDVLDIRVVVGKAGHETPIFSSVMSTVVFSPYWNIPDSIAEGETLPALIRNPNYLQRNHIEVLRRTDSGVEPVDASSVDWDNEDQTQTLMFRQTPGAHNALGQVKFLFPNEFDVYLHDTPADSLFSRTGRAFSHGCIRVEEPETLATYVMRGASDWDTDRILAAMNAGVEQAVKLPEPIPVHIVYFTASVDEDGGLHLLNDVYGYDARQAGHTTR